MKCSWYIGEFLKRKRSKSTQKFLFHSIAKVLCTCVHRIDSFCQRIFGSRDCRITFLSFKTWVLALVCLWLLLWVITSVFFRHILWGKNSPVRRECPFLNRMLELVDLLSLVSFYLSFFIFLASSVSEGWDFCGPKTIRGWVQLFFQDCFFKVMVWWKECLDFFFFFVQNKGFSNKCSVFQSWQNFKSSLNASLSFMFAVLDMLFRG